MVEFRIHPSERSNVIGINFAIEPDLLRQLDDLSYRQGGGAYALHDSTLQKLSGALLKLATQNPMERAQSIRSMQAGADQLGRQHHTMGQPSYAFPLLWIPEDMLDSIESIASPTGMPPMKLVHDLLVDSLS